MHPQSAMAMAVRVILGSDYFVLNRDVSAIESNVLIGCVRLRGTNQRDRKIQNVVLSSMRYGKSRIA